ncbi:MAG: MerR family transcriptional regulator [Christensenellaceae bacterium]|jgi:DNA-binding transcriptional MerR regulator
MAYTVKQLAALAGVSSRTLRYYDEIGLLQPAFVGENGYRMYETKEVDRLQQIMFYREMGFPLKEIVQLLKRAETGELASLEAHEKRLEKEQARLARMIATLRKTIAAKKGTYQMKDKEKFEGFKEKLIAKNEAQYGTEIREKYGEETIEASNAKLMGLSKEEYDKMIALEQAFRATLKEEFLAGDPSSETAQRACAMHQEWLSYTWPQYTKAAHMGLGEMYLADERFKSYYDSEEAGITEFLRDALRVYTKEA